MEGPEGWGKRARVAHATGNGQANDIDHSSDGDAHA